MHSSDTSPELERALQPVGHREGRVLPKAPHPAPVCPGPPPPSEALCLLRSEPRIPGRKQRS